MTDASTVKQELSGHLIKSDNPAVDDLMAKNIQTDNGRIIHTRVYDDGTVLTHPDRRPDEVPAAYHSVAPETLAQHLTDGLAYLDNCEWLARARQEGANL